MNESKDWGETFRKLKHLSCSVFVEKYQLQWKICAEHAKSICPSIQLLSSAKCQLKARKIIMMKKSHWRVGDSVRRDDVYNNICNWDRQRSRNVWELLVKGLKVRQCDTKLSYNADTFWEIKMTLSHIWTKFSKVTGFFPPDLTPLLSSQPYLRLRPRLWISFRWCSWLEGVSYSVVQRTNMI